MARSIHKIWFRIVYRMPLAFICIFVCSAGRILVEVEATPSSNDNRRTLLQALQLKDHQQSTQLLHSAGQLDSDTWGKLQCYWYVRGVLTPSLPPSSFSSASAHPSAGKLNLNKVQADVMSSIIIRLSWTKVLPPLGQIIELAYNNNLF